MRFSTLGVCAVVGLGVFAIGCDEATNTTPTPQVETKSTADKAADSAKSAADAVADKAGELKDKTVDAAGDLKDKVKDATTDTTNAATDAGVVAQAQKLYDDAVAAVNKADFSTAEKYFDQLKTYRDKLPVEWQTKIDQLGTMIADAKAKLGNLPSVPGLPK
jgi:hypothetical protein